MDLEESELEEMEWEIEQPPKKAKRQKQKRTGKIFAKTFTFIYLHTIFFFSKNGEIFQ